MRLARSEEWMCTTEWPLPRRAFWCTTYSEFAAWARNRRILSVVLEVRSCLPLRQPVQGTNHAMALPISSGVLTRGCEDKITGS